VFHVIITCPGHRFETRDVKGHKTYFSTALGERSGSVLSQKRDMIYLQR